MPTWHRWIAVAGVVALLATVAPRADQTPHPFSAHTDLVQVDAVVRADGQFVDGLTADDFEVREDGRPMAIETFAVVDADAATAPAQGRFVVLLLDDATTKERVARVKEIAGMLADRLGPYDVGAVARLSGGHVNTTAGPELLRREIAAVKPSPVVPDRFDDIQHMSTRLRSSRPVLDAVSSLAHQLLSESGRRKSIVFIGPAAMFNVSPRTERVGGIYMKWLDALRNTGLANASVDILESFEFPATTHGAGSFARQTGGAAFVNPADVHASIDRILDDAAHYYVLGYEAPPATGKAKNTTHAIQVHVKHSGVVVQTRHSRIG